MSVLSILYIPLSPFSCVAPSVVAASDHTHTNTHSERILMDCIKGRKLSFIIPSVCDWTSDETKVEPLVCSEVIRLDTWLKATWPDDPWLSDTWLGDPNEQKRCAHISH